MPVLEACFRKIKAKPTIFYENFKNVPANLQIFFKNRFSFSGFEFLTVNS